jgi:hypothetical protein
VSSFRWFPGLELVALGLCIPAFIILGHALPLQHAVPFTIVFWLASVITFYVTIRLAFVHLILVLALPIIFVASLAFCSAVAIYLGDLF